MSTWKTALAVLLIFILGAIFGAGLSIWMAPLRNAYNLPAREIVTRRDMRNLEQALSLTPGQKQAIEKIIEDTRNQLVQVRKETRPRVRKVVLDARARVRAQLTPEQQAKFDEMGRRNRNAINRALRP